MIVLIGLGSLFAIMALYAVAFMSLGLGLLYGFVSALCFGCSSLWRRTTVEPPWHRHEEQRNRNRRTSSDSDGYSGYTAGDIDDDEQSDIHELEENLARAGWQKDNLGGYYNNDTGESITHDYGLYWYNEAPEEEDDGDDDSGSGWSLF